MPLPDPAPQEARRYSSSLGRIGDQLAEGIRLRSLFQLSGTRPELVAYGPSGLPPGTQVDDTATGSSEDPGGEGGAGRQPWTVDPLWVLAGGIVLVYLLKRR